MKRLILLACTVTMAVFVTAQNVAITDDSLYTADPSAMLDVKSATKGFLMPRLTTTQRLAVINPATGLLVYDTDENVFYFYNGSAWLDVSSGGSGGLWELNGTNVHLTDSTNKVGVGTSTPQNKFIVKGDASSGIDEAIFAVVSPAGDTLFAVYPEGTRVYVKDDASKASGSKSGFAVGGFSLSKGTLTNEYLRVTPDSVRVYINDSTGTKATGNKGGFAVGGFSLSKGVNDSLYMFSDRSGFNVTYLTQAERDAITDPRMSSLIFNTTDSCLQIFLGYWESIWCTPMGCVYPAIVTQPVNDTAVEEPALFSCAATGSHLYYKWQESTDGGSTWKMLSDGGTDPIYSGCYTDTLIIDNIPENFYGYQYRSYVSNACGNEISSSAILINCYPPVIQTQPVNDTAIGEPAFFSVIATGVFLSYEWQESTDGCSTWNPVSDGGTDPVYSGTNTNSLTINNIPDYYHQYQYRCNISNLCDNELSSTVTLFCIYGGVVFYDDGTNVYISATSDQSSSAEWGCLGTSISGADGTVIGTGKQNTVDIEAGCTTAGIAADICANLLLNGYDDWFLPSKEELNLMYINKSTIGGFSSSFYWSSSEYSSVNAWIQYFNDGSQNYFTKNNPNRVRCVRRD